jgi:hypothetical protein
MAVMICFLAICFVAAASYAADEAVVVSEGADVFCTVTTCKLDGGKVYAKIGPSSDWQEINQGQALKTGDSIKTDGSSSFILEFPGGSTVSVRPNTEMTIDEMMWDAAVRKVNLTMGSGELRTIINKVNTPSEFKIKTPTAICGARGTVFYVKATPTSTSIYVGEGSVDIVNPVTGEVYTVVAGMVIMINADGSTPGPVVATDTDVTGWTGFYTDLVAEPYTPVLGTNANAPENSAEGVLSGR